MATISRVTTWSTGDTLTAAALNGEFNNILNDYNGGITNANISASAAIAYSKLSLSGSIVNADISGSAAIAYSKLNLANSLVAGDLTSGSVTAAKIAASSGIVIQAVLATNTTQFTWGDTATERHAFQATITPKLATSTIYAIMTANGVDNAAAGRVLITLKHETVSGGTSGTSLGFVNISQNSTGSAGVGSGTVVGSVAPGNVTQRFFKMIYNKQDSGGTNYINEYNETSSILLVEVA